MRLASDMPSTAFGIQSHRDCSPAACRSRKLAASWDTSLSTRRGSTPALTSMRCAPPRLTLPRTVMRDVGLNSVLSTQIAEFLEEKRSTGCTYKRETWALRAFDRYLCDIHHSTPSLPKEVVEGWLHGRPHQCPKTQQYYIGLIRQLAMFLVRMGGTAHVPDRSRIPVVHQGLAARVFTRDEVRKLLAAVDLIAPDGRGPMAGTRRHLAFPALFRVLYGCGLRCGEALRLIAEDVDLQAGVLRVREGKFRQDRLVPVSASLLKCLRAYDETRGSGDYWPV